MWPQCRQALYCPQSTTVPLKSAWLRSLNCVFIASTQQKVLAGGGFAGGKARVAEITQITDKHRKCVFGKCSMTSHTRMEKNALLKHCFTLAVGKLFIDWPCLLCLNVACDCSAVAQPMWAMGLSLHAHQTQECWLICRVRFLCTWHTVYACIPWLAFRDIRI